MTSNIMRRIISITMSIFYINLHFVHSQSSSVIIDNPNHHEVIHHPIAPISSSQILTSHCSLYPNECLFPTGSSIYTSSLFSIMCRLNLCKILNIIDIACYFKALKSILSLMISLAITLTISYRVIHHSLFYTKLLTLFFCVDILTTAHGMLLHQKLVANDRANDDAFGEPVVVLNDTAFIGAQNDDNKKGAVYVFENNGTSWLQTQKLVADDGNSGEEFGEAVSVSNDVAFIGTRHGGGINSTVYVFTNNGTTWIQTQKLLANDAESTYFGGSVSVSNHIAFIGARGGFGAVHVFEYNGLFWNQIQTIVVDDVISGDSFGDCVVVQNDVAFIGAPSSYSGEGSVYVFENNGSLWIQTQKLIVIGTNLFGVSISISNDVALIGAYFDNTMNGAAFIFQNNGTTWNYVQKLTAIPSIYFGYSVSVLDDVAVIGAPFDSTTGAVYVFDNSGTSWIQREKIMPTELITDNRFGGSLSISASNNLTIIGAIGSATTNGSAYVFHNLYATVHPTINPTTEPTQEPTYYPTSTAPTEAPSHAPTQSPTNNPTSVPSVSPTQPPTHNPSEAPSLFPTHFPTSSPFQPPTSAPTAPTDNPTSAPSSAPSAPTHPPSTAPTHNPILQPSFAPTQPPSTAPTFSPSQPPTTCPDNDITMMSNDRVCVCMCNELNLTILNQSLQLNIEFNVNTIATNKSNTFHICEEKFGTTNETEETLEDIDGIFETVFRYFDKKTIYEIINGPFSALRDGLLSIDCNSSWFNIIELSTNISIQSALTEAQFDHAMDKFLSDAERLLSIYFGQKVSLYRSKTLNIFSGYKTDPVLSTLIGVITFTIVLLSVIYFIYKWYRKNQALKISNPLVLSVAVGKYDELVEKPEFDGYLPNLSGIDIDVKISIRVFQNTLNYTVLPQCLSDNIKQSWTKKQLLALFEKTSQYLSDNIGINGFDGLFVIISSHGIDDCILTSDYKTISKHHIHRIFSRANDDNAVIRTIPRVFVFDCCDGIWDRERLSRADLNEENEENKENKENKEKEHIGEVENDHSKAAYIMQRDESRHLTIRTQWARNESNPDYNLVILNAANKDFQSKINIDTGSYFIRLILDNIDANNDIHWFCSVKNKASLEEIMNTIQNQLHSEGKQLPDNKFNNVKNIVFVRNERHRRAACIDIDKLNNDSEDSVVVVYETEGNVSEVDDGDGETDITTRGMISHDVQMQETKHDTNN